MAKAYALYNTATSKRYVQLRSYFVPIPWSQRFSGQSLPLDPILSQSPHLPTLCSNIHFNILSLDSHHSKSHISRPLPSSFQRIRPRPCVTFHNKLFCGDQWLVPCPTPKLENHHLSAVRDCLFNKFLTTISIWWPSTPSITRGRAMSRWQATYNWQEPGQFSSMALGYGLYDRGFESRQVLGIFLYTTASRPALGPTQPLSLGVKRQGREACCWVKAQG
jgi:hypothetical protein